MFAAAQIASLLDELRISHAVWLPDSALGPWEAALDAPPRRRLVRVCREGEAWTVAAGLLLAGARPMVMIQCTGLFESGDALRNVLFDLNLPLYAVIGYRSYLAEGSSDTARRFTEPILRTWGLDYLLLERPEQLPAWAEHYRRCAAAGRPGVALLAEGRM